MRILYLAHRIPYPPNKGDKIRSFNEIRYLSRSHEIDLACLVDDPDDMRYENDLRKYCRNVFLEPLNAARARLNGILHAAGGSCLSVGYFYSRSLQRIIDRCIADKSYDGIICFSSPMAEYVLRSGLFHPGRRKNSANGSQAAPRTPRLIMDFCDVDSDKWAQYAERSSFPKSLLYSFENRRLSRYEGTVARLFDHSVFVSEREAELFKSNNPDTSTVSVIANGVDSEYFDPASSHPLPKESITDSKPDSGGTNGCRPTLVFTGAMDYFANEEGITWFCTEILPRIRSAVPDIRLFIVGRSPSKQVLALDDGNSVRVTGYVDDVRPYYEHADVCVIPLRIARGLQNKVLESMAMGKSVVATPAAVQGIEVASGEHILLAGEPESFADAVICLLRDEISRRRIGAKARDYVVANYGWKAKMTLFDRILLCDDVPIDERPPVISSGL
jgi:sugar transferase (PEP-CTERM/EpsH1 system associated)